MWGPWAARGILDSTRGVWKIPAQGFSVQDFPVMRFFCNRVGNGLRSSHRTFSLLPIELVPYRKLSILYIVLSVLIRFKRNVSLLRALDIIADELCSLAPRHRIRSRAGAYRPRVDPAPCVTAFLEISGIVFNGAEFS